MQNQTIQQNAKLDNTKECKTIFYKRIQNQTVKGDAKLDNRRYCETRQYKRIQMLMGISALTRVSRNIGNSQRNRQKSVEKVTIKKEKEIKKNITRNFLNLNLF